MCFFLVFFFFFNIILLRLFPSAIGIEITKTIFHLSIAIVNLRLTQIGIDCHPLLVYRFTSPGQCKGPIKDIHLQVTAQ